MNRPRLRTLLREPQPWFLTLATLLFFHRPLTGGTFFFRDLYLLFYPKKLFLIDAIRSGQIPLWDPLTHNGQPFLASPSNLALHPTNLLFFVLPPMTAFNVNLVLQFILCGWATYALARVLGLQRWPACAAAVAYTFCGYTLSAANLTALFALPWVPAGLTFIHLYLNERRGRWLVLGSISAAMPLLSGAAEVAGVLWLTAILWTVLVIRKGLLRLAAILMFGVGLSLIQTLPAVDMVRESSRSAKRPYSDFAAWSVAPQRLPELIVPRFFGPTDTLASGDYWGARHEEGEFPYILSIYFGPAVLFLAILGASSAAFDRRMRIVLALIAAFGFVFSLGSALPFFRWVYDYVPVVTTFRYPVKALMFALLPVALLAGAGAETLRPRRAVLMAAAVAVTTGVLSLWARNSEHLLFGQELSEAARAQLTSSLVHAVAVGLVVALLVFLQHRSSRDFTAAIAAIVFVDLAVAGYRVNAYADREQLREPPIAERIRALTAGGRFHRAADPIVTGMMAPSNDIAWLAWWRLNTLAGYTAAQFGVPVSFHDDYDGLAPRSVMLMTAAARSVPWPQRLRLLSAAGVTVFMTRDRVDAHRDGAIRGSDGSPLFVYTNEALPVRFASVFDVARDEREAIGFLLRRPYDSARVVLTERRRGSAAPHKSCSGSARVVRRTINSSETVVDAPCDGYVVFSDTFYPGWEATVDGSAAPIVRADGAFSAIAVSAGRHTVVKAYRPRLPLIGAIASLVALIVLVAAARLTRSGPSPILRA